MKIGINGLFLRKIDFGIGRFTKSVLEELARVDKKNQYIIYTDRRNPLTLPMNFKTKVISTPLYRREDLVQQTVWEKVTVSREADKDQLNVFFSPYNSVTRLKKIPHLVLLHDVVWKVMPQMHLYNFRRKIYAQQTFESAKTAQKVLTVSEFSKKEMNKYLGIELDKVRVIGAGVSPQFKPMDRGRKTKSVLNKFRINKEYIFYIGGFESRKNVPLLIRAFSKIANHYSANLKDKILVIGGEVPRDRSPLLDDVKGLVKTIGMEDKIKFIGKVSDDELVALYNEAEFFIFPSLYEGFGLPVLEAMSCGTPVIASEIGSLKEIAQDTVQYFHPEREDELVQCINRFLTDEALKEELKVRALNRARNYSWEKVVQNLLSEIQKVV